MFTGTIREMRPFAAFFFSRECAGTGDQREPESHSGRRVRPGAEAARFGAWGGPNQRFGIAERTRFSALLDFLEVEFFRGLSVGNVPRRCHNCGKYFLLTAGYNTCYCNNIAPGETERTCRKVGAHRKEARDRAGRTPAQIEYDRAYNRLKQRKNRKKITIDEWNVAVAKAQGLLERSERGELADEELKQQLDKL